MYRTLIAFTLALTCLTASVPAAEPVRIVLDDFADLAASPWGYSADVTLTGLPAGKVSRGSAQVTIQPGTDVRLVKPIDVPAEMQTFSLWIKGDPSTNIRLKPVFKDRQGFGWQARDFSISHSGWKEITFSCAADDLRKPWQLDWWKRNEENHPDRRSDFEWKMTLPLKFIGFECVVPQGAKPATVLLDELAVTADVKAWAHLSRSVLEVPQQGSFPVVVTAGSEAVRGEVKIRTLRRNDADVPADQQIAATFSANVPAGQSKSYETELTFERPGMYEVEIELPTGKQVRRVQVISAVSGVEGLKAWRETFPQQDYSTEFKRSTVKTNRPAWKDDASKPFVLYVSELSPAWLIRNNKSNKLDFFAGSEQWGLGAPTHIAVPTAGGAKVYKAGAEIPAATLAAMDRSWLLVWFAGAKGYDQFDTPYLVTLQHKPASVTLGESGLSLTFKGKAEYASVLPLFGAGRTPVRGSKLYFGPYFKNIRTETWTQALPKDIAEKCDFWAQVTKAYPVDCDEQFRVDPATDEVIVKSTFTWQMIEDDWGTKPLKFATIPPVLANCHWSGEFPVTFEAEVFDPEYPTVYGPVMGIKDADEYTYRMKVLQYIHEVRDLTAKPDDSPLVKAAREQMASYLSGSATSHNTLNKHLDGNVVWGMYNHYRWQNSNMMYLDHPGLEIGAKVSNQFRFANETFWRGQYKETDVGVGRTFLFLPAPGWGFQGDAGKITNDAYYTAWLYGYATGDWQLLADRWDEVISRLNCLPFTMCWSRFGRDAIAEGGDEGAPPMGMARVAWMIGDMDTYAYASYLFARELTHHYLKVGAGVDYFRQYQPVHPKVNVDWKGSQHWPIADEKIPPRVNVTNMWAETAGWILGGPPADQAIYGPAYWDKKHAVHDKAPNNLPDVIPWSAYGSGQWVPKWARFDAEDVFRFYTDHRAEACKDEFDTWQRVEFPGLPKKYGPVQRMGKEYWGHDGYPTTPWRLMQLRADILGWDDEKIAQLFPPKNWPAQADQTFYQGMVRSGMERETVRIIPKDTPASPFQAGLQRDCVANPSWNNPVMTPAGIIVKKRNGPDKGKVEAINWPVPCYYFARPPRVPGGQTGTGNRWAWGYITPGGQAPKAAEQESVNWVLDMYWFE